MIDNNWKEADLLTSDYIFLLIYLTEKRDWIHEDDIAKISCEELAEVDYLWQEYSQNRFGFSTQYFLYESLFNEIKNSGSIFTHTKDPFGIEKNFKDLVQKVLKGSAKNNLSHENLICLSDAQLITLLHFSAVQKGWAVDDSKGLKGIIGVHGKYLTYDELQFELSAPLGHLPSYIWCNLQFMAKKAPMSVLFQKFGIMRFNGILSKYCHAIERAFLDRIRLSLFVRHKLPKFARYEQLNLFPIEDI